MKKPKPIQRFTSSPIPQAVKMKALVTGSRGQLGSELCRYLEGKCDVVGIDIQEFDFSKQLDALASFLKEQKPDVVFHCAAFTRVDDCETRWEKAFSINAVATARIASVCADLHTHLVYISTDYVFDGTAIRPYTEFDQPRPLSVYGKSKLAGEEYVREIAPRHQVVRTSWLHGPHGQNFANTIIRMAREEKTLRVVSDQVGSPTFTFDLVPALYQLWLTGHYGLFHLTNEGETTWNEFAKSLIRHVGIHDVDIQPITTEEFNRPAPRPRYSVLRNFAAGEVLGIRLPEWLERVNVFVNCIQ